MNDDNPYATRQWPPVSDNAPLSITATVDDDSLRSLTQYAKRINALYALFYLTLFLLALFEFADAYGTRFVPYNWFQILDRLLRWLMYFLNFPFVALMSAWIYSVLKLQLGLNVKYEPSRPARLTLLAAIPYVGGIIAGPVAISIWKDASNPDERSNVVTLIWTMTVLTGIAYIAYYIQSGGFHYAPRSEHWTIFICAASFANLTLIARHLLTISFLDRVTNLLTDNERRPNN